MKQLIFNLVNGVRSGIPMCCTLFFSYRALFGGEIAANVYKERTGKEFDIFAKNDDGAGESDYVLCNRCHAKKKVKEIRNNGVILRRLMRDD